MKLFKKLLGVVGVTGALVASAPASAFLTLDFLDGNGASLGFVQETGSIATAVAQFNGWRVSTTIGQSDNPSFGLKLTVTAYHRDTQAAGDSFNPAASFNRISCLADLGCQVKTSASLGNGNTSLAGAVLVPNTGIVGSVEQSILKIRFNDNTMPTVPGALYQITESLSTAAQYQRSYNTFISGSAPAQQFNTNGVIIGLPGAQSFNTSHSYTPNATPISLTAGVDLVLNALSGGTNMNITQPFFFTYQITAVPEPGTIALLGLALIGVAVGGKRRRAKASA